MTEQPLDESAIFAAAREISDPGQLAQYLRKACGTDTVLLLRLQALLAADCQSDDFLDPTATHGQIDTPPTNTSVNLEGTTIGPYKLLQKIGEGGMGVVFMADQTKPVERRVAVKVIKPGLDSRAVIARFEAERQAIAMMDHPNIARVLDVGTDQQGHPYFAMELVKGMPITQYCDDHRLSPRERLELFIPVCQAIQHAHQKGIIHRDIKPSNVLVAEFDDRPVPKVIDFGIAKATQKRLTENTLFTAFGQVVGTLDYMSPEQTKMNQLDIDTRSDVYALGVLLYELLTGHTPFDRERLRSAALAELVKIIQEEDPPRPSLRAGSSETLPSIAICRHLEPRELTKQLTGDLDWIIMKTLEKDRVRRYPTANDLARDLTLHLNDKPVSAGPPSVLYRFRKLAKRHRGLLTTAFLFMSIIACSMVALAYQVRVAKQSAIRADAYADEADRRRQQAESSDRSTRLLLYRSNMAQAAEAISVGDYVNAREILARVERPPTRSRYANEWHVMNRIVNPDGIIHFHGEPLPAELTERYTHATTIKNLALALEGPNLLDIDALQWLSPDLTTAARLTKDGVKAAETARDPTGFRKQWFAIDRELEKAIEKPDKAKKTREQTFRKATLDDIADFPNPFSTLRSETDESDKDLVSAPPKDALVMNYRVPDVSVSPDGRQLVVVNEVPRKFLKNKDKFGLSWLRVFDLQDGRELWRLESEDIFTFDHLGPFIAVSHHDPIRGGDVVKLYDPTSGIVKATLPCEPETLGARGHTTKFTITKDLRFLCGVLDSNHLWTADLKDADLTDDGTALNRELLRQDFSFGQSMYYNRWEDLEIRTGRPQLIVSDGGRYCASHNEGYLTLWDLKSRMHVGTIATAFSSSVYLQFSKDESRLLSVNYHATVQRETKTFTQSGVHQVSAIQRDTQWTPEGAWVNGGRQALELSFKYGRISYQWLRAHTDDAELLACQSPNGKSILTTSNVHQQLTIRNSESLAPIATYKNEAAAFVGAGFSADGNHVVTLDLDGNLICRKLGENTPRWSQSLGDLRRVFTDARFWMFDRGRSLVVRTQSDMLASFDVETGRQKWQQPCESSVLLTSDGNHLLLTNNFDSNISVTREYARQLKLIRLIDGETFHFNDRHGTGMEMAEGQYYSRWKRDIACASVSGDGKMIAVTYEDAWASVWSLDQPNPLYELRGLGRHLTAVAFSPDDQRIVFAHDRLVSYVDASSGEFMGKIKYAGKRIENLMVDSGYTHNGRPVMDIRFDSSGALKLLYQTKFPTETMTKTIQPVSAEATPDARVVLHNGCTQVGIVFPTQTTNSRQFGTQQFID